MRWFSDASVAAPRHDRKDGPTRALSQPARQLDFPNGIVVHDNPAASSNFSFSPYL